jgi:hypothetical protein
MSRGYVIFGDIEGKLATLNVECRRCGRAGRYSVAKLIGKHGRKGNLNQVDVIPAGRLSEA